MSALADIAFLRPLWALAVPAIVALAVLSSRRAARIGDWSRRIDPHLMRAMAALGRVDRGAGRWGGLAPFVVAGLAALALTGPALERGDGRTFRNLDGVVFAIDVSGSMTRDARWPAAVAMARAGLSALGTKPAGLIVYGGDAYDASALTTDHLQLGQTISLLDEETAPDRGARPALALRRAAAALERAAVLAGDVVLVTDGGGFGPEALVEAEAIARMGGRLSVVRAETTVADQAPPPRAAFEALARVGGGAVYDLDQAEALMATLAGTADRRLEAQEFRLLFWTDYGRWLLLLALIPAATFFRRETA